MKQVSASKSKNRKSAKKINLSIRDIAGLAILAAVILFAVSGWVWWSRIVMNPERALSDTIANSLQTKSITKQINQSGLGSEIKQTSYLSFYAPTVTTQTTTVLTQKLGDKSTAITTETIGTLDTDYVSYKDIKSDDNISKQSFERVMGKWAKNQPTKESGEQPTVLNESIFSIMPIGNLDSGQRDKLIGLIQQNNVYKYSSVEKKLDGKRPVYVYKIALEPIALVTMLQEYVRLSGVGDPQQFDPSQYAGAGAVDIELTIDILSRQLTKVEYPTGRTEIYSGQNLYRQLQLPQEVIPMEELQRRLQGL